VDSFINAFLAYFVMVDPIGVSLIFNALIAGKTVAYGRTMAVRAVLLSVTLVLIFGFWGVNLLTALGIEMESFKIAGGLLIFYTAFGMITKPDDPKEESKNELFEDISVFPLTIPLIAGPGCLTLTVLLFSDVRDQGGSFLPLVIAVIAIFIIMLVSLLLSSSIIRIIGRTGNNILKRLLGVLLASLAIQFIVDGVKGFLN
jgi:multiple antibiotic resistance protein